MQPSICLAMIFVMAFAVIAVPVNKPASKSIDDGAEVRSALMEKLHMSAAEAAVAPTSLDNIVPLFVNPTKRQPSTKYLDDEDCTYDKEYDE